MCKKKYSRVRSCLNRLIGYFHHIKFFSFLVKNSLQYVQNYALNCVKGGM